MTLRPCLDCGAATASGSRCDDCRREADRSRNAARPGHRSEHARQRRRLEPLVAAGAALCSRCGAVIRPGDRWHADRRATGWYPAHGACNEAAGGRREP